MANKPDEGVKTSTVATVAALFLTFCGLAAPICYPYGTYDIVSIRIPFIIILSAAIISLFRVIYRFYKVKNSNFGVAARIHRIFEPLLLATAVYGFFCLPPLMFFLMDEHHQRQRTNQWNTIAALKAYATAQVTFKRASIPGNTSPGLPIDAYADNFRNLYYGRAENGERLHLINRYMADGYLIDNFLRGASTVGADATKTPSPYQGYYFIEDPSGLLTTEMFDEKFALMAIPAEYGYAGFNVYWINETGKVYEYTPKLWRGTTAMEILQQFFLDKPDSTPLAAKPRYDWRVAY